jgi:hypothetical protein
MYISFIEKNGQSARYFWNHLEQSFTLLSDQFLLVPPLSQLILNMPRTNGSTLPNIYKVFGSYLDFLSQISHTRFVRLIITSDGTII